MNKLLHPPTYCPDALATDIGWINPKNGEILVLVRDLRKKLEMKALEEQTVLVNKPILEDVVVETIETPIVDTPSMEIVDPTVVVKRRAGRPRKVQP